MGTSHGKIRKNKYKPQNVENGETNTRKMESYKADRLMSSKTSVRGCRKTEELKMTTESLPEGTATSHLIEEASINTLVASAEVKNEEETGPEGTTRRYPSEEASITIPGKIAELESEEDTLPKQERTVAVEEYGAATAHEAGKQNSAYLLENIVEKRVDQEAGQRENSVYLLESSDSLESVLDVLEQESATASPLPEIEKKNPDVNADISGEVAKGFCKADGLNRFNDDVYADLREDTNESTESPSHADEIVNDIDKETSNCNERKVSQEDAAEIRYFKTAELDTQESVISDHPLPLIKTNQDGGETDHINVTANNIKLSEDPEKEDPVSWLSLKSNSAQQCPKQEEYVERDRAMDSLKENVPHSSNVRKKYKVRLSVDDDTIPPIPPRQDIRRNQTDTASGVRRRRHDNALSLVLPLKPSRRPSRRQSENVRNSLDSFNMVNMPKRTMSRVEHASSDVMNILPLPPKANPRTLPNNIEGKSRRRFDKNATLKDSGSRPQRSGSYKLPKEHHDHHLPRRAQTLHKDQFDDGDTQFLCLLDLPLKHKGSIVSPEKLIEKNVHDFFMAAKKGETDYVRTLLTKINIDIDVSDRDGMTALHYACRSGNPETVALLIDRGACINSKTIYGSEPLMVALREKPEKDTARKWHQRDVAQVVHMLVSAGASVHSCDANGLNTLLVAISVENNYTTDYLLDNGANPNYSLILRSMLHVISIQVSRGIAWIEIERKMLENGANPNVVDCCGNTPASLLFYSEFVPFRISDIEHYVQESSCQQMEFEKYMDLPSVLRLGKPNKNTFSYTRKRLNRLLVHLRAGLDMNNMPADVMLPLNKFLLREQNAEVLRLFHACGHYPDVGILRSFVPNQVDNFVELWELLETPANLMVTAASVVRVHTRPNAHLNAKGLPLPKSIIQYVTLDAYEEIFQSVQRSSLN